MTYWLAFPLTLVLLSPIWLDRWGGSYLADKFQMSQETWGTESDGSGGGVRTSEGTVGPPRN